MDFVAASAPGNTLQSYGPEGFVVSGVTHGSGILLTPDFLQALPDETITLESLQPLLALTPRIEFLVIGTGAVMKPLSPDLRQALRIRGLSADAMDTGAACRTYAVMHSEGRRVGAALLRPA